MENRVDDLAEGAPLERQPPRQHLVDHDARGEEIGALIDVASQRLLGRHIRHRAQHRAGQRVFADRERDVERRLSRRRLEELREAEVQHLHLAAGGHDDVRALDVAVDDAAGVRLDQRVVDLHRDADRLAHGDRPAMDPVRQQFALDVLHHDVVGPLVLADVVDGGDVRRAQRRGRARLGQKSRASLLVVLRLGRQKLERDLTTEPGVFGEIDLAHAACPEAVPDPVVLDRAADHPAILTAWN